MNFIRLVLLVFCCVTLGACGEDTSGPSASVPATQPQVPVPATQPQVTQIVQQSNPQNDAKIQELEQSIQ